MLSSILLFVQHIVSFEHNKSSSGNFVWSGKQIQLFLLNFAVITSFLKTEKFDRVKWNNIAIFRIKILHTASRVEQNARISGLRSIVRSLLLLPYTFSETPSNLLSWVTFYSLLFETHYRSNDCISFIHYFFCFFLISWTQTSG